MNAIPFTKDAYEVGKFAYVSDYARLKIFYENGGIYFDTDVEIIKLLDDIIEKGAFMDMEKWNTIPKNIPYNVNVGLGFGMPPKHPILREILDLYEISFYLS